MQVHHILKSKANDIVFTVSPDSLVSDAAKVLADKRIGTVVISTDGTAAEGILSERDIVRQLAEHGAACLSAAVSDYMTTQIQTCTRDEEADAILARMTNGRFGHMPVVEDGRLIGLITIGDVVKARLSELSMEKSALEGMIMGY